MRGKNSILLLNTVYYTAANRQATGTSGGESLFTGMLAVALHASLLVFSTRFLRESYSDFYCGPHLTTLDVFQGDSLGVRIERKAFFFLICVLQFTIH